MESVPIRIAMRMAVHLSWCLIVGYYGILGYLSGLPGAYAPALLDPAPLKIDSRANLRGGQVLTIQPGSSDRLSAVRVGLCATCRYALRLRQGFA
jgi:hypothetical protein